MKLLTWFGDVGEVTRLRCKVLQLTTDLNDAEDRAATAAGEARRLQETLHSVDLATEREVQRIMRHSAELEAENARLRARLCEVNK